MQQIQTNPTDEHFLLGEFANRLSRRGAFYVFIYFVVKKDLKKVGNF